LSPETLFRVLNASDGEGSERQVETEVGVSEG